MAKMFKEYFYPMEPNPVVDKPIKSFLPAGYDSAAIVFHPFIKMPDKWKPERSASPNILLPVNEDSYRYGSPISWEEMRNRAGIRSITELHQAINTWIGGVQPKYARPDLLQQLKSILGQKTFMPKEDQLSELLIDDIIRILKRSGSETIHYARLYESGYYVIEEMTLEEKLNLCREPFTLYDINEEFIFTCYFDNAASIFISKTDVKEVLHSLGWEGIICDKDTTLAWAYEGKPMEMVYSRRKESQSDKKEKKQ